jgi:hypothetical protein
MKKMCFLLVFLVFAVWAYPVEIKFMSGANLSKSSEPVLNRGEDPVRAVYGVGAVVGGGIEFTLTKNIAFEVDALYFQKGSRVEFLSGDEILSRITKRLDELSFPVLFKFRLKQGTSPYILGGGELALMFPEDASGIDYGLVCGIGFRKQMRSVSISLEGRYHHGLQDTRHEAPEPFVVIRKMRVFAFMVGLSI